MNPEDIRRAREAMGIPAGAIDHIEKLERMSPMTNTNEIEAALGRVRTALESAPYGDAHFCVDGDEDTAIHRRDIATILAAASSKRVDQ